MIRQDYIFTSESVSEGHPDKVCDRISDAVLDAFIGEEPEARVACETFATTNRVVIGGGRLVLPVDSSLPLFSRAARSRSLSSRTAQPTSRRWVLLWRNFTGSIFWPKTSRAWC